VPGLLNREATSGYWPGLELVRGIEARPGIALSMPRHIAAQAPICQSDPRAASAAVSTTDRAVSRSPASASADQLRQEPAADEPTMRPPIDPRVEPRDGDGINGTARVAIRLRASKALARVSSAAAITKSRLAP
jgi:hypothetical protein